MADEKKETEQNTQQQQEIPDPENQFGIGGRVLRGLFTPVRTIVNGILGTLNSLRKALVDMVKYIFTDPVVMRMKMDNAERQAEQAQQAAEKAKPAVYQNTETKSLQQEKEKILNDENKDIQTKMKELAKLVHKEYGDKPLIFMLKDGTPVMMQNDGNQVRISMGKMDLIADPVTEQQPSVNFHTEYTFTNVASVAFSRFLEDFGKSGMADLTSQIDHHAGIDPEGRFEDGNVIRQESASMQQPGRANRSEEKLKGKVTEENLMNNPDAVLQALKEGTATLSMEVIEDFVHSGDINLERIALNSLNGTIRDVSEDRTSFLHTDRLLYELASNGHPGIRSQAEKKYSEMIKNELDMKDPLTKTQIQFISESKDSKTLALRAIYQSDPHSKEIAEGFKNNPNRSEADRHEIDVALAKTGWDIDASLKSDDKDIREAAEKYRDQIMSHIESGRISEREAAAVSNISDSAFLEKAAENITRIKDPQQKEWLTEAIVTHPEAERAHEILLNSGDPVAARTFDMMNAIHSGDEEKIRSSNEARKAFDHAIPKVYHDAKAQNVMLPEMAGFAEMSRMADVNDRMRHDAGLEIAENYTRLADIARAGNISDVINDVQNYLKSAEPADARISDQTRNTINDINSAVWYANTPEAAAVKEEISRIAANHGWEDHTQEHDPGNNNPPQTISVLMPSGPGDNGRWKEITLSGGNLQCDVIKAAIEDRNTYFLNSVRETRMVENGRERTLDFEDSPKNYIITDQAASEEACAELRKLALANDLYIRDILNSPDQYIAYEAWDKYDAIIKHLNSGEPGAWKEMKDAVMEYKGEKRGSLNPSEQSWLDQLKEAADANSKNGNGTVEQILRDIYDEPQSGPGYRKTGSILDQDELGTMNKTPGNVAANKQDPPDKTSDSVDKALKDAQDKIKQPQSPVQDQTQTRGDQQVH